MMNSASSTLNQPRRWKRRQFIVDARFQWGRLVLGVFTALAILVATSATIVWIHLFLGPSGVVVDHNRAVLYGMAVVACAVAGLVAWFVLRDTHRIAGPAFKITRALREVAGGKDPGRIRLRQGDQLIELACEANVCIEALLSERGRCRQAYASLSHLLHAHELHPEEMDTFLTGLRTALQNLEPWEERWPPKA
jgi:hypothetical protein